MRKLTDHIVEGDSVNHQLTIEATDQSDSGGAHHRYEITGFDLGNNHIAELAASALLAQRSLGEDIRARTVLVFQNGPIKEAGVNGVTQEALLAIVIDRLRGFQEGPFATKANENALNYCKEALYCLQARTRERMERGVEGTHQK